MGAGAVRRGRGLWQGFGAPVASRHGPAGVRARGHHPGPHAGQGARHGRPAAGLHQVSQLHLLFPNGALPHLPATPSTPPAAPSLQRPCLSPSTVLSLIFRRLFFPLVFVPHQ